MRNRGFTLIELVMTLAIAGILTGLAVWQIGATLPGHRVGQSARRFLAAVRFAPSIAARANEPVHIVIDPDAPGCGPSWQILVGASPAAPRQMIDRVCLGTEARGVSMAHGGTGADVGCSTGLGPDLPNCSLCKSGARLTFYPTGRVVAVRDGVELGAGHSIVFSPTVSPTPARTLAVGVRAGTGEARIYRPGGAGWECP